MATVREKAVALNLDRKLYSPMHRPPDYKILGKAGYAQVTWNSVISHLQARVEVKRRRSHLKFYNSCFVGSDAVDVVLAHVVHSKLFGERDVPRATAVRLCQALMERKVFEAVGSSVFGKDRKHGVFQDADCCLYRFLNMEAMSLNPSLENVLLSPLMPSFSNTPCSWQEGPTLSPDKSAEIITNNMSTSPQTLQAALPQTLIDEVWQEQILLRLLQMMELPVLDGLLHAGDCPSPSQSDPHSNDLVSQCSSRCLDRGIIKAFRNSQNDEWLAAAMDCLEYLPDHLVVEVSRELPSFSQEADERFVHTRDADFKMFKLLLFDVLVRHYGLSCCTPLLPDHMSDIYTGIIEFLVNGRFGSALEALQLCLKLLHADCREELHKLLKFMAVSADPLATTLQKEVENRMAVKRAFSRAIVNYRCLSKGKSDLLVLFMLDNNHDIFKGLHFAFTTQTLALRKGLSHPQMLSFWHCSEVLMRTQNIQLKKKNVCLLSSTKAIQRFFCITLGLEHLP
ncbi:DEP domain-containing protein 7-like isoform X2 [Denticeps clupeoides]|uniref:DEP domain-containing protein 7-like isoform X2 n=1 Tax=Denticeps clupeoides TaxID=299321 RepID=UPI0010A2D007|nr:DEP domain-containing protein 7-like isoform X2 [Denticeps clupeoides]